MYKRTMNFPFFDETKDLDDSTRTELGGTFVKLPSGFTHYELSGSNDGAPVVLVHGFSVPFFIFDPTYKFLANSGFQVLRYDLLGRGFTDKPNLRYDMHRFVGQLKELLDAFGYEQADLIGLSMGGPITAAFVEKFPSRVRKHVMIDPSGISPVQFGTLLEMVKIPVIGELLIGLFGTGKMVKGIADDLFDPNLVEIFQEKYKIQMQYKGFKRAILSTLRNDALGSFQETYAKIGTFKKPTLLFWGENDTTTPFDDHKTLMKLIPHTEFHLIRNCSHIPHYEKADIVNPILKDFLLR